MHALTSLISDLRQALRRLARAPAFTALAVALVSLALGAHLTIVGVIDAVLLRPLPVPDADRLLGVYETRDGRAFHPLSYLDFLDIQRAATSFTDLAAHYPSAPLHLDLGDSARMVNGSVVTGGYFSVLGIEAAQGRFFADDEDTVPDAHPVVVVSHELWRNRLGGRDDAIGSTLTINRRSFTVVGVAPRGFDGLAQDLPSAIWMPAMMAGTGYRWCDALADRDCRIFDLVGRLAAGHDRRSASAEMRLLGQRHAGGHPTSEATLGLAVAPLTGLTSKSGIWKRRLAGLLLVSVTLLVVVAAANLSGLLIGRGIARQSETALRLALGAPRFRVVSQFVAEALLLAGIGSLGGLLLVGWLSPVAGRILLTETRVETHIGPTMLVYALLLAIGTALVVGLVPGWQASRSAVGIRSTAPSHRRSRLLAGFVIVQIALSFVLASTAALLGRSLVEIGRGERLDPDRVATLRVRARLAGYGPEQGQAVVRELVERIAAMPGVESVGFGRLLPIWTGHTRALRLPHEPAGDGVPRRVVGMQALGPGAFESVGIPLLAGRDFGPRDVAGAEPVAVVNRSLALRLWASSAAVGQTVVIDDVAHRVIGVVRDSILQTRLRGPGPQAYTAFGQDPSRIDARIVLRTTGSAGHLLPALRRLAHDIDPAVPVTEVSTLAERLRSDLTATRTASHASTFVALLAALSSAIGLAGLLALSVARRVREIGIRRALGAANSHTIGLVVRHAVVLVTLAFAIGWTLVVLTAPLLRPFLHGLDPRDPWTLGTVSAFLLLVAILASWWPAHRANTVDPIEVLRRP